MLAFRAFVAGFLATLVFHQGVLYLLHKAGASPRPAFNMAKVPPLGVPQVISLAFWGGIWAIALAYLPGAPFGLGTWLYWILFGAVFPTVVALWVVLPMKGMGMKNGFDQKLLVGALILNGAWGFGTALLLRLLPAF